jgi:hypothetical protein
MKPHGNNTVWRGDFRNMRIVIGLWACTLMYAAGSEPARVPVLLELFTSEGCSSCPPADQLLAKLDREQGIAGAEVIVLSEHVDYWNHLGWSDPFSSPLYSERQREYAAHLDGQTYTPELVVDGAVGFVGSNQANAEKAIRDAAKTPKEVVGVTVERVARRAKVSLHVNAGSGGTLYLALAHDVMKSQVSRGENAGRGLTHVGVAYAIEKVGKVDGKVADFDRTVTLKAGGVTRVVAFVSETGTGRIVALGQAKL